MASNYNRAAHCVYLLQYHIVWCSKYRFFVLKDEVETALKNVLQNICQTYNYEIKALEVMPDHVHLFVSVGQTVTPCDIVCTLKSISTIKLLEQFPHLRKLYSRKGSLWSRSYFISSIGNVSEVTVKKYIEEQKGK